MPKNKNESANERASRSVRKPPVYPGYARGNDNWNTERYKESVRTAHTDTRAFKSPMEAVNGDSYYYDNTPAALRERRRRNFEERREAWRDMVKKNRLRHRAGRRFLSFLIIIATVTGLSFAVYKLFFVVKDVNVTGDTSYPKNMIVASAGLDKKKNLFSFSSRIAGDSIRFYCPRISVTDFDRSIPDKVTIAVEEESPVYYAEIYGDIYGISNSLRVLGKLTEEETAGLIKLKLQTVGKAVSGSKISMISERAQKILTDVTDVLSSSEMMNKVNTIDLRNDFDIVIFADNRFKLIFGTEDQFETKVRLAEAMINDEIFRSGAKASINLKETDKTSVIIDNQLVLD